MSVKIRVSYDTPERLEKVLKLLNAEIKTCKVSKSQKGQFKKAYIELKE